MMLSTERLLTDVYRIPATPVQRAACRVRDGLPLAELAEHPDVAAAFGGPEAVAALPSEHGVKPSEFWSICSARTAKTTIAAAGAIADSQSVDLAGTALGDEIRISILSLTLDVAGAPFAKLTAAFEHPALRPLLVESKDSERMLVVRHPSGAKIQIAVVAGGKAGGGIANRWCAGLIADEAPKMNARGDDKVTNLTDVLSVARERMLTGALINPIGSPWAPSGDAYDAVQAYFGKPTDDTVVMRTTGPAGNPSYWTPERLAKLEVKDPVAWRINALGEFIDPETGLLSPIAIRRATRETPLELVPEKEAKYAAAVDTGEGRLTLAIVEGYESDDDHPYYRVALAREFPAPNPGPAWAEIAATCQRYGLRHATVDQYAASASAELARQRGLTLHTQAWNATNRLEAFTDFATLLHADRIELPPHREFRRDLLAVKKRASQSGGYTIILPRQGGRHCDFAPAVVAAMRAAVLVSFDLEGMFLANGIDRHDLRNQDNGTRWGSLPGRGF